MMTIKFSRILLGRSIGCQDFWVVAGSYIRCFSPTIGLSEETIRKNNPVNPVYYSSLT